MTGRVWLIQFLEQGVVDEFLDPSDVVWPAVCRFHTDIELGDKVVLWAAGAKDSAGVFALGVVDGALEDLKHAADYRNPEGPRRLRPSMPVRYTHFFDGSRISRAQLKADPAFDGFSLFRRANQQNPFPLTVEQWEVIWAAVPAESDLSAPKREFAVVLGMETSEADPRSAARDLERCFADRAWERLEDDAYEVGVDMDESAEVAESDQVSTRPDPMVVPPDAPFVIGWECLVYATSEADALRRVYADLYADIGRFGAGEFTLYPVSGG